MPPRLATALLAVAMVRQGCGPADTTVPSTGLAEVKALCEARMVGQVRTAA